MFLLNSVITGLGVRLLGAAAMVNGSIWLLLWFSGIAERWSAEGVNTVKTNMALCQLLAGVALVLLAPRETKALPRWLAMMAASVVLLIGALTLSEHVFGYNVGIDQVLANEPPGAAATASPNRMGPPGSCSLILVGVGLLFLAFQRPRFAAWLGLCVCVINLIPAVGFLYGISGFYSHPRLTGISWPTVMVLLSLGAGLILARPTQGPAAQLLRDDAGGILLRRLLPAVILMPLVLGFLRVKGQERGWYDTATGTGGVMIIILMGFLVILWRTARALNQTADAKAKVEAELRDREERFTTLVEQAPVGIFETDSQGDCNFVNDHWQALAGLSAAEAAGKGWAEAINPDDQDRVSAEWYAAAEAQRVFTSEYRFRTPGGKVSWVMGSAKPIRDASGAVVQYLGTLLDITERKRVETELAKYREELEQLVAERTAKLQELVGELEHFSYTITHDLKAPLRAMRGFAQVAGEVCGQSEARPFLEKISAAAERMDLLIRDALDYSQAVRRELPLEDVDTGPLLRGILDSYPQFQSSKAHIRVEGPLPVVVGNEAGLTQCFSNLLGNAVKFVKRGQMPEVRVWAEVLADGGGWARFWVEDNGIGIPRVMLPRLFDMFSRANKEYEGTGIGLALVRKVVQRMGGRVGVESEEGKGSRFWMELKLGQAAQPSREQARNETPEHDGRTVLYVEDEENDAMLMEMAFAAKGMESALRVVADGRAAIDYLSGTGKYADRKEYPVPSVVLLDLNLPLLSGFAVLEWIRNNPDLARKPVVVFSSSTLDADRAKARQLGANEFLAKPSSGLELGRVVDELKGKWMPWASVSPPH